MNKFFVSDLFLCAAARRGRAAARACMFACAAALFCAPALHAQAFWSGEGDAPGNALSLGTLGIDLDTHALAAPIRAGATSSASFSVSPEAGSIASQYLVGAEKGASCTDAFWNGVLVSAEGGGASYLGPLSELDAATTTAPGATPWALSFSALPTLVAAAGETCAVTLHVRAWQQFFSAPEDGGFSDDETVALTLTAADAFAPSGVVLNEILPNPESSASGVLGQEFVELYNNSASAIDVLGWSISEMSGAHEELYTISAVTSSHTVASPSGSTIIPAHGFLVLLFHSANKINNDGDTIRLYDTSLTKLDEYAFTTKFDNDTDSDSNATPGTGNAGGGPETAGNEGKSYARIPDGTGAWVDPIPTPGGANELEVQQAQHNEEQTQGGTDAEGSDAAENAEDAGDGPSEIRSVEQDTQDILQAAADDAAQEPVDIEICDAPPAQKQEEDVPEEAAHDARAELTAASGDMAPANNAEDSAGAIVREETEPTSDASAETQSSAAPPTE